MKHVFIVNPTSGKGNAFSQIEVIQSIFKDKDEPFEIIKTQYKGHAIEIAKRYTISDDVILYAVGGDGTAYEVLNGINEHVPMGIIPAGTGNDFHRMVAVKEKDLKKLIEDTVNGKTVYVDYGLADSRRFLNCFAVGLDGDVNQLAEDLGKKLPIPRKMVYIISALIRVLRPKRVDLDITFDGQQIKQKSLLITIMNGKWYGGGFYASPDASIVDGKLDFCLVKDTTFLRMLQLLPKYYVGKHLNEKEVTIGQAEMITIKANRLTAISCDGETNKQDQVSIRIMKKALAFRVPTYSPLD